MKRHSILPTVSLVLVSSLVLAVGAWESPSTQSLISHIGLGSSPRDLQLVYFFGSNGEFLVLDLRRVSVQAYWTLSRLSGVADKLPRTQPRTEWGTNLLRYDPQRSWLYGVFPRATTLDVDRILVLHLPSMEVKGIVDIPPPEGGSPNILVSPDGTQLLVSYAPTKSETTTDSVVEIYDAKTLEKIRTIRERVNRQGYLMGETIKHTRFTKKAYFGPDGRIYDRDYRISIEDGEAVKEYYDPVSMLTDSNREQLRAYERTSGTGRVYLDARVIDSAAGKGVVTAGHPGGGDRAMWVVDLMNGEVVSPLLLGKPSSIPHLTPQANIVLLEGTELRTEEVDGEPRRRLYKTGHFWIYDARTMELKREFEAPELAGLQYVSMVLCIAPDRPLMFYAANGGLFAVNLENPVVRRIDTPFFADSSTECVFAIR